MRSARRRSAAHGARGRVGLVDEGADGAGPGALSRAAKIVQGVEQALEGLGERRRHGYVQRGNYETKKAHRGAQLAEGVHVVNNETQCGRGRGGVGRLYRLRSGGVSDRGGARSRAASSAHLSGGGQRERLQRLRKLGPALGEAGRELGPADIVPPSGAGGASY